MTVDQRTARDSPGSTAALRTANQQRILDVLLRTSGASVTQADLSRATGLAAGTVSNIVRELASSSILTPWPEPADGARRCGWVEVLAWWPGSTSVTSTSMSP